MNDSKYGSRGPGRGGPTRRQFLQRSAVAGLGAAAAMAGTSSLIKPARAALEAGAGKARLAVLLPLVLCAPLGAWAGAGMETGIVVALCTVAVGSEASWA